MEDSTPSAPQGAPVSATDIPSSGGPAPEQQMTPGQESPFTETEPKESPEPAPEKAPSKKYKVKDGDEEHEVDEAELLKGYQRARSATKRFEEAAKQRQQVESILSALKTNPIAVLQRLGIDPRTTSETYLRGVLEDEMLQQQDPRGYELRQKEKALEEREEKYKAFEEQQQAQQFEVAKSQAAKKYEQKFMQALETSGLPRSPFTVKRMAEYERHARQSGYDLSADELGSLVKEDVLKEVREMMGHGDPLALLGDDVAKKLRESDLARHQQPRIQSPGHTASPAKAKEKSWITESEWKSEIKRLAGR